MNKKQIKTALSFLTIIAVLCGCSQNSKTLEAPENPKRAISLAPNLTEMMFAIDAQEFLVGRTKWCNYPEKTKNIPIIGDYSKINIEATILQKPDVVLTLPEHQESREKLEQISIPSIELSNRNIAEIEQTILQLGTLFDRKEESEKVVNSINEKIADARASANPNYKPKILLTIGRNMGSQGIESVHCVGLTPFHNEIIEIAGGVNACQINQPYPKVSLEGMIAMNPDIIIDLIGDNHNKTTVQRAQNSWMKNKQIRAVQNNQVHVLAGDHTVVPGPRIGQIIDEFSAIISKSNGANNEY